MTCRPALAVIWVSRSRSFPVGMPEIMRRNARPRFPRDGRFPWRSRPSVLAPVKSRSSITIARAPCSFAVAMRVLMAARSRPSRVAAGSPASSSGTVNGTPRTFPSGAATATARWPALRSTAMTGNRRSSPSAGAGARGIVQLASRYHRADTGSRLMS
jgi:hypothetical protein